MRNLVAIPLLLLVVIAQTAIMPAVSLLAGYADLVLVLLAAWALQEGVNTSIQWALLGGLMVSLVSHLPWFIYLGGYTTVVLLAQLLQRRVWQLPLLAMFTVTFLGTILMHIVSYAYIRLFEGPVSFSDAMGLVTLPSLLLNLLFAIPAFGIMRDVARWVFPAPEAA
jgi:rod shape-determining protein MreD